MSDDQITIEVDGKSLAAKKGQMLIEVTDANDIYIPRFCYHPKLSVAANCRMCLVDVEKAPKPLPACATPVMDGMKVRTQSELAISAQKSVMEFLLINHPLDCPICDQGGECELQDMAMGYGRDVSRYQENKRVVKDKNIGPLVQTDMTRCIHCTRCVRFGEEIAGMRELGATGRGEHMEIGTYIEKSMSSELSGNVIDVCPVGALTSKPFRFSARAWEMKQGKSIAPHDCVGSNVEVHFKGNKVKRVVPAENQDVNEVWLSDRDRFSYEALYAEDRLTSPMIKEDGHWQTVDWEQALAFSVRKMTGIKNTHGAESIGGLISPSATLEECYLFQKLLRGIGSSNIDHRLRQMDFRHDDNAPVFPSLGCSIFDLENQDAVLLIGSHIRQEHPLLNLRLRKAALKGGKVMFLNATDSDINYSISQSILSSADKIVSDLSGIVIAMSDETKNKADLDIDRSVTVSETHRKMAENLLQAEKGVVLLGVSAVSHKDYSVIQTLVNAIAKMSHTHMGFLTEGANAAGAWIAGAVPHRSRQGNVVDKKGLNTVSMLSESLKAFLLFHLEPEHDLPDRDKTTEAMKHAELVISFTAYDSDSLREQADVMLPIALFAENEGTFVNVEGRVQSFSQLIQASGEARCGWKILRVLANKLGLNEGFEQSSVDEIREALVSDVKNIKINTQYHFDMPESASAKNTDTDIKARGMYSIDPILRRATALSQSVKHKQDSGR